MNKSISKGVFYGVVIVLLLWTASLSYSFIRRALPEAAWWVPLFALVVFDAGMIAWLKVFLDYAEGTGQRAIALSMTIFDLLGVGLMVLAEVFLGGQSFTTAPALLGESALWGIAIWTVANVAAVIAFHLSSPIARKQMAIQAERDAIFSESLERLKGKRAAVSGQVADGLADGMLAQLLAELRQQDAGKSSAGAEQKSTRVNNHPVKFSANQDGAAVPTIRRRESK